MKTLLILLGLLTVACGGGAEAASAEPVPAVPAVYAEVAFSNPWQTAVKLCHHGESDLSVIPTPEFRETPAEGDRLSFYGEQMYLVRLDDWCQFENENNCAMISETALPFSEFGFFEGGSYVLYFADNGTEGTDDDIFLYAEPVEYLH